MGRLRESFPYLDSDGILCMDNNIDNKKIKSLI